MIRINLLPAGSERHAVAAPAAAPSERRLTTLATLLVLLTVLGIGGWFWTVRRQSAAIDRDIASAELQAQRLQPILARVRTFEDRQTQLQQRVSLIEQLRAGQSAPARMLDQISRSVPDDLWLADMTQAGSDLTIAGFTRSMTALSDFAAALEATRWFRKPVEILDSEVTTDAEVGDLVRFVIKATYVDRDAPAAQRGTP